VAKPQYSTGVSDTEHKELLDSVEAREARRQKQLSDLPLVIGQTLRGRTRPEHLVASPRIIPKNMLESLGRRLNRRDKVAYDQFTRKIPTIVDKQRYDSYKLGGNRRNKRVATGPEDEKQVILALQRQVEITADYLHKHTWQQWQLARLYKASSEHVLRMQRLKKPPLEIALRIAASATEDLGSCLLDDAYLEGHTGGKKWLPTRLIEIGQYAATEPQSLRAQHPELMLVVMREQERRETLWGDNLLRYEDPLWGGDRRTNIDRLDEIQNDLLIGQLS
jgi:hypothetical protein